VSSNIIRDLGWRMLNTANPSDDLLYTATAAVGFSDWF
jgi:hypothetical protein